MIYLRECLTEDTPIYVSNGHESLLSRLHHRNEKLFTKDFNHAEFIGEELCILKNIRSAHYFLSGISPHNYRTYIPFREAKQIAYGIGISSQSFLKPKCEYKSVTQYGLSQYDSNIFEEMLKRANGEKNREELCNDMLKLLALDIYMGQTDRFAYNYLFEEDKEHNIRLAPIFDFQYSVCPSYISPDAIGYGDLHSFHSIEDCREFAKKYPKFLEYLASYLDENLLSVSKSAYAKRRMIIPERSIELFQKFDHNQKEKIKRIVQ